MNSIRFCKSVLVKDHKCTFSVNLQRYISCSKIIERKQKNYYDTLHISRNATKKQIKDAYLKLSKKSHPDSSTYDPLLKHKFSEISHAYNTLNRSSSRNLYDQKLFREHNAKSVMNGPHDFYTINRQNNERANEGASKASHVILYCITMIGIAMLSVMFLISYNDDIHIYPMTDLRRKQIMEKRRQRELLEMLEESHKYLEKKN